MLPLALAAMVEVVAKRTCLHDGQGVVRQAIWYVGTSCEEFFLMHVIYK